jgi:hypothetical protein
VFKSKTTNDLSENKVSPNLAVSTKKTPTSSTLELYDWKSTAKTSVSTNAISSVPDASATPKALKRKNSNNRLRVDGCTRTRNLKKSIKVMIIIIVLFLLSWLPIHMYRLATTFYPLIKNFWMQFQLSQSIRAVSNSSILHQNLTSLLNRTISGLRGDACSKLSSLSSQAYKDCLLSDLKNSDSSGDYTINTLHNRYVFFVCYFMAMSSVCYNPIVYFWMHKKFRAEVKILFVNILSFRCRKNPNPISNRRGQFASTLTTTTATTASTSRNLSLLTSQGKSNSSLIRSAYTDQSSRKTSTQTNQTRPSLVSTQSTTSHSAISAATAYNSCYLKNEQQASSSKIFRMRKFGKLNCD